MKSKKRLVLSEKSTQGFDEIHTWILTTTPELFTDAPLVSRK